MLLNIGVGKTGCAGGVHPVTSEVVPVEDQAVAKGGPTGASLVSGGHLLVRTPGEVLSK